MEKATYFMLRKTLALWKAEDTIDEVLEFAKCNKIDEVIWKIDTEEFSHGLLPLDMIREYLPCLNYARQVLNKNDIKYSINPWVTLNHADRGRQASLYHPDMRMFVAANGKAHSSRACPMDRVWQEWLIKAYKLYASTKPEILWLEDDFTNNPKECRGSFVKEYGCFCDAHIGEISKVSGTNWTQKSLLATLKKPGQPHQVRSQWYELLGRIMIELGERLEREVHSVSRDTKLGLMCSWSNDGRWWDEFVQKISGPHQPVVRPSLSSYFEQHPSVHLFDSRDHRKECKCLPENSRICPELENQPYSVFSKSARFTNLELGLSQLMGYSDITINMFDHLGTPMSVEKKYYQLLGDVKPLLNGIASKGGSKGKERGVGLIFRKRASDYMHLKDFQTTMDLQASAGGEGWASVLQAAGIAVTWEEEYAEVLCTSGQVLRACSNDEIIGFLSKGLLIDASGLEILCERGFSSYVGCQLEKWIHRHDKILVAEELIEESPDYAKYMSIENISLCNIALMSVDNNARVISYLINNARERILPGMVLFENNLGGRIAVYPLDIPNDVPRTFLNWHRKEQMFKTIWWLSKGKMPLFVEGGAWMIPLRRDYKDYIFIGLVNLDTDNWDTMSITLSADREMRSIKRVQRDGTWKRCESDFSKLDNSNTRIYIDESLDYMDFTAFVIE